MTEQQSKGFRVTVEDLDEGGSQTMEIAPGDLVLIPFAPAFKAASTHHANGTTVITVKDHNPQWAARIVESGGA